MEASNTTGAVDIAIVTCYHSVQLLFAEDKANLGISSWEEEKNRINYCFSLEKMCQVASEECQWEDMEVDQSFGGG